jgi:hypothetical protein
MAGLRFIHDKIKNPEEFRALFAGVDLLQTFSLIFALLIFQDQLFRTMGHFFLDQVVFRTNSTR